MKLGLIVECAPNGPEQMALELVLTELAPGIQREVITLINKRGVLYHAAERAAMLLEQGCDKVGIVWDLHPPEWGSGSSRRARAQASCADEVAHLKAQLAVAGVPPRKYFLVCIIQELETWCLADHRAIKRHIEAKTRRTQRRNVRKTRDPEGELTPEDRLESLFAQFDTQFIKHVDTPGIIAQARQDGFRHLARCGSFTRFVEKATGQGFPLPNKA